ncbi:MAG: HEAT repeat domain-containing protein [Acidobacteria bacterium]|nr:HEAT repeat domain-containing protein [Acidobacteriota bacterium]
MARVVPCMNWKILVIATILFSPVPLIGEKRSIPRSVPKDVKKEIEGLQSREPKERVQAAVNLKGMGDKGVPAIPFLIDLLADDTPAEFTFEKDNHKIVISGTPSLAAMGVLKNLRTAAVESLVEAMTGSESLVRVNTARVLWSINKDPRALSTMMQAAGDSDKQIRIRAARALGEAGDAGAIEVLISSLKDPASEVRAVAVDALGLVSSPLAIEPLRQLLKDENGDIGFRAAQALKKQGWTPEGRIEIVAFLVAGREWNALAELGEAAVPALIEILKAEWSVAWRASETLRDIGDPAVGSLLVALKDGNSQVRCFAAKALNRNPDPRVLEALITAVYDPSKIVCQEAAEGLRQIEDSRFLESLCGVLMSDRIAVNSGKIYAAEALGKIGDKRATPALLTALKDSNESIRESAADALAELRDTAAADSLLGALDDPWGDVRVAAADALWKTNRDIRALDAMIASTKDVRMTVQSEARLIRLLREITNQPYAYRDAAWQRWWTANRETFLEKLQEHR